MQDHDLKPLPKGDELVKLHLVGDLAPKGVDPSPVSEIIMNSAVLLPSDGKNGRSDDLRSNTIKPRVMLEGGLTTIPNMHHSGGREEGTIALVHRRGSTNPRLVRASPLEPKPTQTQSTTESLQVRDAQASEVSWPTNF